MSYRCTCPSKGSFKNADGTIRCVACAHPEEIEAEIVRLRAERGHAVGALFDACADLAKARAEVESLTASLLEARQWRDEAREALAASRAAQHQAEQKAEQSLKAAGALLAALEDPKGDFAAACDHEGGCSRLSTHQMVWEVDSMEACDEHAKSVEKYSHSKRPLSVGYLSYAPALRALRALLGGTP